jgi:hypothetical protein
VRIDTVARPPLNNENNAFVEVVEGRVDQFRETLPLLDLNRLVTLTKLPSLWAERAMVVNPVDNADATPVRPPRTGGLRGQAHQ